MITVQSVESSVNNLVRASEGVSSMLREVVSKFKGVSRRAEFLESEKILLIQEVTTAEAEVKTLKEQLALAKFEAEAAKDEVKS